MITGRLSITIKKQTLEFIRKTALSLAKIIVYKIVYVIIHFVIIIISYLTLIRLLFVELGLRQIKWKYKLYSIVLYPSTADLTH